MLGALLLLLGYCALAIGKPTCSDGQALVPVSVTMTSMRKRHQGPDKCADGDLDTVCTTKKKPYSTITLDFGKPVEIAKVRVVPNLPYPRLSEARIIITNDSVPAGTRADEGYEVEGYNIQLMAISPEFSAFGRYLIIQKDRAEGGRSSALSVSEVTAYCSGGSDGSGNSDEPSEGSYVPGNPGGPWSDEEVFVVKEKVRHMIDFRNAKYLFHWNEHFPPIVNTVYGNVWKPEDPTNKHWFNRSFSRADMMQAPTTRKLLQLAFHDCLKNVDSAGNHFGGCDGCLNWEGMDFMNEVPLGHMGSSGPEWPSYRAMPIKYKTDNNKLSTTAMALEMIYTDPTWPPGPRELTSSLRSTGKSRADLWQLAANTALEIEIAKANYGCSHKVSYQQMVVALEGKEKCLWKLQKPVPFQYGRADCVRDASAATTDFPFEATNKESHSNPFGQGDWVLKDLKRDFEMPARQSIALMAVHGIAPEKHNKQLEIAYRWGGNPFLSNNYFKTLGSRPQYSLNSGIRFGGQTSLGPLVGDERGRPLSREVQGDFSITMKNWWNTSHPDSGPWFFRPMTVDGKSVEKSLQPRWPCFQYNYEVEAYEKKKSFWSSALEEGCSKATINQETGVQTGGPPIAASRIWGFSFYLPYELSFVKDFTVDAENHPRGCNIPDVFPEKSVDGGEEARESIMKTPISCGRTSFKLDGEDHTSADIVDQFADDHEVWAHAFIEGWQTIQKNGYNNGSLQNGPKSSWLGYSLLPQGTPIEFPLLFTENLGFDLTRYLAKDEATGCMEMLGC